VFNPSRKDKHWEKRLKVPGAGQHQQRITDN
jgi:hypothetical protein